MPNDTSFAKASSKILTNRIDVRVKTYDSFINGNYWQLNSITCEILTTASHPSTAKGLSAQSAHYVDIFGRVVFESIPK